MIKVVIQGNWAPYFGTDYCDALGIYPNLEAAWEDAKCYAWDRWEPDEPEEQEDDNGFEDEGPDYYVAEYDPDLHDMLKAGGGNFADDFARMR